MSETEKILILEQDEELASAIAESLSAEGLSADILQVASLASNAYPVEGHEYDLLVVDLDGNENILGFYEKFRTFNPNAAIIVTASSPNLESAVRCLKGGAYDYLTKPILPETVVQSARNALENRKLFINIINLSEELKEANSLLAKQKDEIEREKNLLDRLLTESNLASDTRKLASLVINRERLIEEFFSLLGSFTSYDAAALILCSGSKPFLVIDEKKALSEEDIQQIREIMLSGAGIGPRVEGREIESFERESSESSRKAAITYRQLIPLMINDEFLGSIAVFSSKKTQFSSNVKNLLRMMAAEFAMVAKLFSLYEENKMLSVTDGLTKIFNNRYFQEMLARDFDRIKRYNGRLSLLLLDVDNFKSINDTYGHQQGDIILIELAQLLKKNTRKSDLVARYGGEEFVVVMPETDAERGVFLAETLRKKVAEHCFSGQGSCRKVTVSIGISEIEDNMRDQFELIGRADQALYRAKRTGKNKVCLSHGERIIDDPLLGAAQQHLSL
ncbi:MAG: diguanylate cyclase [Nitrospirota bacterium]|nr:diguanylate cyclase [Nitrospirota bacterium]